MAIDGGRLFHDWTAVLAEQGDLNAREGKAAFDRMNKYILCTVRVCFDQKAQIGNQHKAGVSCAKRMVLCFVPALYRDEVVASAR